MGQQLTAQDGQLSQARRAFDRARLAYYVAEERGRVAREQGKDPEPGSTVAAWRTMLDARRHLSRVAFGLGIELDLSSPRNAMLTADAVREAAKAIVSGEVITARQLAGVSQ